MTFDDDFIQLNTSAGVRRFPVKANGMDWPPPERIVWEGFVYERERYSQLTDEQRTEMDFIMRGAEYNCVAATNEAGSAFFN